ncbi:hypothetical protein chiPu_0016397 [Chiloscyllium punctatum]|uniref:Uncharacterized protein n=1 Tax=Chiloscyllium punctatum TaxID=137246 RepID=A0A401T5H4_CHIPU|nr:hypothetical protein [Chiloscyllium punctatum]
MVVCAAVGAEVTSPFATAVVAAAAERLREGSGTVEESGVWGSVLFQRDPRSVLITDFFGSVRKVEITSDIIRLTQNDTETEQSDVTESQTAPVLKYVDQLAVAQIIHQKPKQTDWHPPDGFILGLWTLILLVFFKSYGLKHLKHVF